MTALGNILKKGESEKYNPIEQGSLKQRGQKQIFFYRKILL